MTESRGGRRRHGARGFTVVELVMSLSVLAIGVAGIVGMQHVTIGANRHAKNLSIATRIGQAWLDALETDAALWTVTNGASTLATTTTWLKATPSPGVADWAVPAHSAQRAFGPGFSALGSPIDPAASPQLVQFCTQIRLTFVKPEMTGGTLSGSGVIRTQVRVFWRRDDSAPAPDGSDLCSVDRAALDANIDSYHVVYFTSAVRQAGRRGP